MDNTPLLDFDPEWELTLISGRAYEILSRINLTMWSMLIKAIFHLEHERIRKI